MLDDCPLSDAPKFSDENYSPNGMTPLYDAIGCTISRVEDILKERPSKRVLFVVMTDGQENSSVEFNIGCVREKIKDHPDWQFVFLGANIDTWSVANHIGGEQLSGSSFTYTASAAGVTEAFNTLGNSVRNYRTSEVRRMDNIFQVPDTNNDCPDSNSSGE